MTYGFDIGDAAHAIDQQQDLDYKRGYQVINAASGSNLCTAGTNAFDIDAAAGDINFGGGVVSCASETVNLSGVVDANNPRKVTIYRDGTGSLQYSAGTAEPAQPSGATRRNAYRPAPPSLTGTDAVVLATVWLSAGATNIVGADIIDRRLPATLKIDQVEGTDLQYESVTAGNLNGVRIAGDASNIGVEISQAIADGLNLIVPPTVTPSYMTLDSPIDERPPDGWAYYASPSAPEIDGSGLGNSVTLVDLSGSEGSSTSITADVAEGDTSISVTDETIVSKGDLIVVESDDSWHSSRAAYTKGELAYVESTSAGSVTLRWGAFDSYTAANNAQIIATDAPADLWVENLRVFGAGTATGNDQFGLSLNNTQHSVIRNPEVHDVERVGIGLSDVMRNRVINPTAYDIRPPASTGYAINLSGAATATNITGGQTFRTRSGYDISGGRVARFNTIADPMSWNNYSGAGGRGIATHAGAEYTTIVNPITWGNQDQGVFIRSPRTNIIGGISAYNGSIGLSTFEYGCPGLQVTGFTSMHNYGNYGVALQTDQSDLHDTQLTGVVSKHNQGGGLFVDSKFEDLTIDGGQFSENDLRGIAVQNPRNVQIDTEAKNNGGHGLELINTTGGNNYGKVSGVFTGNGGAGITREDAGYDYWLFDGILAANNTGTNFAVTAQTNDIVGDVLQ